MYVSPNRLLISWKEQSIQYYQEESPIRQAMTMAAEQNRPYDPPPPPSNKPEKKKAATYRPASQNVAELLAQGGGGRGGSKSNTITFI